MKKITYPAVEAITRVCKVLVVIVTAGWTLAANAQTYPRPMARAASVGRARVPAAVWGDAALINTRPFTMSEDVDLTLVPKVRWQSMSSRILRVMPDRNGRLWYQLKANSMAPTLDQARELIAREFKVAQPQLSWIRPLLFEAGGRVWFLVNSSSSIKPGTYDAFFVAYDGKTFVERPVPADYAYTDGLILNGEIDISRVVAQVEGVCFFAASNGVVMYDGKSWSTREFDIDAESAQPFRSSPEPVYLFPELDGKGLVVVAQSVGNLWRWRDGKWKPIHYLADRQVGGAKLLIGNRRVAWGVAPVEKGIWVFQAPNLRFVPWDNRALTTAQLIEQLDSDKYAERESATKRLIDIGQPVLAALKRALATSSDEESKARLEQIIQQVYSADASVPTNQFGPYTLTHPCFITSFPDGAVVVGADSVVDAHGGEVTTRPAGVPGMVASGEKILVGGVLRMDRDGHVSILGGEDLLEAFRGKKQFHSGMDDPPVFVNGTDNAWFMGARADPVPTLINWRSGAVISRGIGEAVRSVAALTADGILIFHALHGFVAYSAKEPDTRSPLAVMASMDSHVCVETGDGTIWGVDEQANLLHFDGEKLQAMGSAGKITELTNITAGSDSIVFAGEGVWHLISPTVAVASENLDDLIAEHSDLFAHFQTPFGKRAWEAQEKVTIEADAAGNVWLLKKRQLKVFSGGKWIDAGDALIQAGVSSGQISLLAPIGDGSHVYIGNGRNSGQTPNSDSFLASVKDGQIQLVPTLGGWVGEPPHVMSSDRRLVIFNRAPRVRVGSASLLSQDGVMQTVPDFLPLACDAADDLWGQGLSSASDGTNRMGYTIIHGKERLMLPTSQTPLALGQIFAATNGHVYVRTDLGLGELASPLLDKSISPAEANGVARLYSIPGLPPNAILAGVTHSTDIAYFQSEAARAEDWNGEATGTPGLMTTFFVRLPRK